MNKLSLELELRLSKIRQAKLDQKSDGLSLEQLSALAMQEVDKELNRVERTFRKEQ